MTRSRLAAADWRVNAAPNLISHTTSQADVERFIESIEVAINGDSDVGKESGGYVCAFRFADLRHDGFVSLIALIGAVERGSCSLVEVIDRTPSGFELFASISHTEEGKTLPSDIRDLSHDGSTQLLLHTELSQIPQQCTAAWTSIFAWTGANYTNVSSRFPDFYRQRLDTINRIIPGLPEVPGPDGYSRSDKECLVAEAAAIQRFLGISPDAGMDQAIRVATSSDNRERDFATLLLAEIGTPKAREYLQKLAEDRNSGLAYDAKYALFRSRNGPMTIASDSFLRKGSVQF